jgi:hypothetical protein
MSGTQRIVPAQATGTVTVTNYAKLHLTAASGTITYGTPDVLTKAHAHFTVSDYANIAEGATVTVNGIVLTEGTHWNAETDDATTAHNIGAAIETATATTLCNGTHTDAVVDVTAVTGGVAGNSITLASSDAVRITRSSTTLLGGLAASTVTVRTSTFTCVAAAPGANQFSSIEELEALIEAVTDITSSQNGTVVAISAATAGTAGNAYQLAVTGGTGLARSGATLTGGYNAATVTVNGTAVTESAEWNAETNDNTTATNLAAAIEALDNVSATAATNVVTVKADGTGLGGNAYTLASSTGTDLALSGSVLSGGNAGIVGTSGSVIAIYGINVQAGANTCNVDVYDGTTTAGTLVLRLSCTASVTNSFDFPDGIVLPSGCFINFTLTAPANPPTACTVRYIQL